MTARRVLALLLASLCVIVLAVWLSSKHAAERGTLAGDPVLRGLDNTSVNSVTQVRMSRGDGTHVTIDKAANGWSVAERSYPADSGKVRKLLLDLAGLSVVEEKTSLAENYPALGVQDTQLPGSTGTRLDVVTPGKTYSVIIGKASGTKAAFVRVTNSKQSVLASPSIGADADPRQWLDHTLIDIAQERIRAVEVRPASGAAYTASRTSKDQADFAVQGVPKGRELSNPTAADPVAGGLGAMSLDDVQKSPASAPTGLSHVIFTTFDGLKIDVAGHKDGTRDFVSFAVSSSAPATQKEAQTLGSRLNGWDFEIPSYKYDGLFRALDDLLKPLPEKPKAGKPADSKKK